MKVGRTLHAIPLSFAAGILAAVPMAPRAQAIHDPSTACASWIAKKGYSRDYVEQRTGSRPPPRNKWQDNVRPEDLQVGDVVVVTLWPGHVALIEEITRDKEGKPERLRVSSFNYGRGERWIDRSCDVAANFGVETRYWISVAETVGYWRPGSRRK